MPKTRLPYVVLDTNLYISFLTKEAHTYGAVKDLLEDNGQEFDIVLPAIVYTEVVSVARVIEARQSNTPEKRKNAAHIARRALDGLGLPIAEIDQHVAEEAGKLIEGTELKAADALIVATAMSISATYLYTNDQQMLALNGTVDGLQIVQPPEPRRLPMEF